MSTTLRSPYFQTKPSQMHNPQSQSLRHSNLEKRRIERDMAIEIEQGPRIGITVTATTIQKRRESEREKRDRTRYESGSSRTRRAKERVPEEQISES